MRQAALEVVFELITLSTVVRRIALLRVQTELALACRKGLLWGGAGHVYRWCVLLRVLSTRTRRRPGGGVLQRFLPTREGPRLAFSGCRQANSLKCLKVV